MNIFIHLLFIVLAGMVANWIISKVEEGMVRRLLQIIAALILLWWLIEGWNYNYGINIGH